MSDIEKLKAEAEKFGLSLPKMSPSDAQLAVDLLTFVEKQLNAKDAEIVELTEHYKIACVDRESLGKERDKLLRQLANKDKCAYIGPMRDCPTHGESPKLQRAREALEKAVDVILWMSGSADFAPGGQAHQGWLKAQSDIEIIRAALREIGGEHEPQS